MRKISLHFCDLFLTTSSISSNLLLSIKFHECMLQRCGLDKTMTQQLKYWILNATKILVVQRQIFINEIHVCQVESNS